MRYKLITLIGKTLVRGELGQYTNEETTKSLPCEVKSINRTEWTMAGQAGIAPSLVAKMRPESYNNEPAAEIDGQRYAIYRTYQEDDNTLELYLQKETGA